MNSEVEALWQLFRHLRNDSQSHICWGEEGWVWGGFFWSSFWKKFNLTRYKDSMGEWVGWGWDTQAREGHCSVGGNPPRTSVLQRRPGGFKHKTVSTEDATAPAWAKGYLRGCTPCQTEGERSTLSRTAHSSPPLHVLFMRIKIRKRQKLVPHTEKSKEQLNFSKSLSPPNVRLGKERKPI